MSQIRVNRRLIRLPADGGGPIALPCESNPDASLCCGGTDAGGAITLPVGVQRWIYRLPQRGGVGGVRCKSNPTTCSGTVPSVAYDALSVASRDLLIPGGAVGTLLSKDDPNNCSCPCSDPNCLTQIPVVTSTGPNPGWVESGGQNRWGTSFGGLINWTARTFTTNNVCNTNGRNSWITANPAFPPIPIWFYDDFYGAADFSYSWIARQAVDAIGVTYDAVALLFRKGCCSTTYNLSGGAFTNDPTKTQVVFMLHDNHGTQQFVYESPVSWCGGLLVLNYKAGSGVGVTAWPASINLGANVVGSCPLTTSAGCPSSPAPTRKLFFGPFPDPQNSSVGNWSGCGGLEGNGNLFSDFVLYPRFDFYNSCIWEGYWSSLTNSDGNSDAFPWGATCQLTNTSGTTWQAKIALEFNTVGTAAFKATYTGSVSPSDIANPNVAKQLGTLVATGGVCGHWPTAFYFY